MHLLFYSLNFMIFLIRVVKILLKVLLKKKDLYYFYLYISAKIYKSFIK